MVKLLSISTDDARGPPTANCSAYRREPLETRKKTSIFTAGDRHLCSSDPPAVHTTGDGAAAANKLSTIDRRGLALGGTRRNFGSRRGGAGRRRRRRRHGTAWCMALRSTCSQSCALSSALQREPGQADERNTTVIVKRTATHSSSLLVEYQVDEAKTWKTHS